MRKEASTLLAVAVTLASCGGTSPDRVVVAAGTTLVDSGLLDAIVERYEEERPRTELSVVGESTLHVLELGRRGGADLLLTHAPLAEEAFVADGLAASRRPVLCSRFLLAGPPDRAKVLAGLTAAEALRRLAGERWTFVTRADGSGTHAREVELWGEAGLDPTGAEWYVETGLGMGPTLQVADQRRAFTLAEIGAFRAAEEDLSLVEVRLRAGEPGRLDNPYSAIVVEGEQASAAGAFVDWLQSPQGQEVIVTVNEELFGEVLYAPGECPP